MLGIGSRGGLRVFAVRWHHEEPVTGRGVARVAHNLGTVLWSPPGSPARALSPSPATEYPRSAAKPEPMPGPCDAGVIARLPVRVPAAAADGPAVDRMIGRPTAPAALSLTLQQPFPILRGS